MSENPEKYNSIDIIVHINEIMFQTEITQYFINNKTNPIELEIEFPKIDN